MSYRDDRDRPLSLVVTLLLVGGGILIAYVFLNRIGMIGSPMDWFRPPPAATERIGPAVLRQIKAVNKLETQSMVVSGIYRAGYEGSDLGNFFYEDTLVLSAQAEVIAGIDLSKLTEADINALDKTVAITLPASELLTFKLDNEASRVFSRERGWLVGMGLINSDPNLEGRARQYAEERLLEDACAAGILEDAAEQGRLNMERMLTALEFTTITINAPVGPCTPPTGAALPTPTRAGPATTAAPQTSPAPAQPTQRPITTPTPQPQPTSGGLTGTVVIVSPTPAQ